MSNNGLSHLQKKYPAVGELYANLEEIPGRTGKKFTRGSLSTINNLLRLDLLVERFKPKHTLEVGLALGGSAVLLAEWHRQQDHPESCHYAIDPFQNTLWDGFACEYLAAHSLDSYVNVLNDYSSLALPALTRDRLRFDFIYIDGSHIFEDVFVDFYYSIRLLLPGGVLVFDDSTDPHVKKVHSFIRANMGHLLQRIPGTSLTVGHSRGEQIAGSLKDFLRLSQMTVYRLKGSRNSRDWNTPFSNF